MTELLTLCLAGFMTEIHLRVKKIEFYVYHKTSSNCLIVPLVLDKMVLDDGGVRGTLCCRRCLCQRHVWH